MSDPQPDAKTISVRRAVPADVPRLASAFARAFLDDPLMTWVVPEEAGRLERLRRFFAHGLGRMVARIVRDVYTTTEVAGAATWAQPGEWKLPARQMLPGVPGMLRAIGPGGLMRIGRAHTFLESKHRREPHAYLEGLATDPDFQRTGVGSALIQVVLEKVRRGAIARLPHHPESRQRALLRAPRLRGHRRGRHPRGWAAHVAHVARASMTSCPAIARRGT